MFLCCFRDNYSEKDDTTLPTVAMSNLEEKKKSAPAKLYDWSSLDEMKKSECEVNPAMRYAGSRTKGIQNEDSMTFSSTLFVDKKFHHKDKKTLNNSEWTQILTWKRPKDICANPKFFVDGSSRFDVEQGKLGDCWLMAAMSSLAMRKDLLDQVVFPNQTFDSPNYDGSFHFKFYHFGQWQEIIVDDYLPCKKIWDGGDLMFVKSSTKNEFWSPLLEKAYAKWNGSYQALDGGFGARGLTSFTGGCVETYYLAEENPATITGLLQTAIRKASLLTASTPDERFSEQEGEQGILLGHVYTITNVVPRLGLVRLRNPWGDNHEWTGPWSDNSPEWNNLKKSELKLLDVKNKDDGEFYMSIQDFIRIFEILSICNISHLKPGMAWHEEKIYGSWKKYFSAGGGYSSIESFATNPQFKIILQDSCKKSCTIIISLTKKTLSGWKKFNVGFAIYQLKGGKKTTTVMSKKILKTKKPIGTSGELRFFPEVTKRFELKPGSYAIIPYTEEANQECDFLLRVFSEKPCFLKGLKA